MNVELRLRRNSFPQKDTASGASHLAGKDIVRDSNSKLKNGKAAGLSGLESEMVTLADEPRVTIIIDLVNNNIVEWVISSEWEFSAIVNCFKWKGDALERRKYRELMNGSYSKDKWESYWEVNKKAGRHWWHTVWFHFSMWNYKWHFYFETVSGEVFRKKEGLCAWYL